jgi:putative ABC transport system permease protein
MAWRETRSSRRRLLLYTTSITTGVAALVAINSFQANIRASVGSQSQTLLGADLSVSTRAPFWSALQAALDSLQLAGTDVSYVTSFNSMALAPGSAAAPRLVDVRGVTSGYPYYGGVITQPAGAWTALGARGREVLVDPAVLVELDAKTGDSLQIGEVRFLIAGTVTEFPGTSDIQAAVEPRVYIPAAYVAETRLLGRGSRVGYDAFLRIPDHKVVDAWLKGHQPTFRGHRLNVETPEGMQQRLTGAITALARYLGLIGLIALLLGGMGVASAVHVFIKDKLDTVAVLRCLGARQPTVFSIYLTQAFVIGLLGSVLGAVCGVAVQLVLPRLVHQFLPLDIAVGVDWRSVLAGIGLGLWVAMIFSLLPLLAVRDVTPLQALRRDVTPPPAPGRPRRLAWIAIGMSILGVSLWQAPRENVGYWFAGAVAITIGLLWVTAFVLMWVTRRFFPHRARYVIRQGIANLFRPQNQTVAVTLALGFGVFLIATLYVVQKNLIARFSLDAEPTRPNLVVFDVQSDQKEGVVRLLAAKGERALGVTPIVPGRIAAINGQRIDSVMRHTRGPARPAPWAARREFRNTYRDTMVSTERLVAGRWWRPGERPKDGIPLISLEEDVALSLVVVVGDRITWNVQGVEIETRIASLRHVEWARFSPNFFAVFQPGVLDKAPQMAVVMTRVDDVATRRALQRDVVLAYPNVSVIDLATIQQTIDRVVTKVLLAIRFMALFSIASGVIILIGAISASRFQRLRECVLLKTLGATTPQIRQILSTEYVALGTLAALTGSVLAGVAGWALARFLFEIPFQLPTTSLTALWLSVVALTVGLGLFNSRDMVRRRPLAVMRELSE